MTISFIIMGVLCIILVVVYAYIIKKGRRSEDLAGDLNKATLIYFKILGAYESWLKATDETAKGEERKKTVVMAEDFLNRFGKSRYRAEIQKVLRDVSGNGL